MTSRLKDLGEPSEFWEYFEQISKIPRCSGHEERIRLYVKQEAEKFGFETRVDRAGNLLVKIPSKVKKDNSIGVVLQCHLDMVCEKNEGILHDFSKDPLKLKILEIDNDKWVTAENTTLGADNGVGIAYILTFLKKVNQNEIDYDSLYFDLLFTVNEERGLSGVFNIEDNFIEGKYLINFDTENDNKFVIGCAGGIYTDATFKFNPENIADYLDNKLAIKLTIKGLIGGHSGIDIHKGRGNALKLISRILWKTNNKFPLYLHSINGEHLHNAIAREAKSIFFIEKDIFTDLTNFVDQIIAEIKTEYSSVESNLEINIEVLEDPKDKEILPLNVMQKLLNILYEMPNGPILYHQDVPNLVHTSTNLASVITKNDIVKMITFQRSLSESSKHDLVEKFEGLFKSADLNINIQHSADFPGWEPILDSELLHKSKEIYANLFQEDPLVDVIHAGLETGILREKFPDLEMISFGPTNLNGHSPDERLNVKSVEKIWNFLKKLLKNLI
jgi:dipeptidase D